MEPPEDWEDNGSYLFQITGYVWKTQHFSEVISRQNCVFSTFLLRQNDDGNTAENSLFCWIPGIIGTSKRKVVP